MLHRALAGLLAAIALALAVGDAIAAPSWSSPQTIARPTCPTKIVRGLPQTRIIDLHATQNARGDRLVTWVEQCPRGWRVVATSQLSGARFGRPHILDHMHGGSWSVQLAATLDARGGAVVAWGRHVTSTSHESARVFTAMRAPQRRFGHAHLVDAGGGDLGLAANARGEAVLAWKHHPAVTRAAPVVVVALRRAGAPHFDGRHRLSAPLVDVQNAFGGHDGIHPAPAAAVADDGSAIVAWRAADASAPDCCSAIEASVRAPGGSFAPAVRVSAPYKHDPTTGPAVAMADLRTAYVAWITNEYGVYPTPSAVTATRWTGGAFTPPTALLSTTENVRPGTFVAPGILLARSGAALAQWISYADPCSPASQFGARFDGATIPLDPSAAVQTSSLVPTDRLYAGYARVLDTDGRPVTAWFDGRAFSPDRYGCETLPTALAGSVDGGPPIAGPVVGRVSAFAFTAAPGPTAAMLWAEPRRVRLAELSGS